MGYSGYRVIRVSRELFGLRVIRVIRFIKIIRVVGAIKVSRHICCVGSHMHVPFLTHSLSQAAAH